MNDPNYPNHDPHGTIQTTENSEHATSKEDVRNMAHSGEHEEHLLRFHPAMSRRYPFRTAIYWLIAIAGTVLFVYGTMRDVWNVIWMIGLGLMIFGSIKLLAWYLRIRKTAITVSNRRVTVTRGIFQVHNAEVRCENINDVYVSQNMLNRMFNVGDLVLTTSGEDGRTIVLMAVKNPELVASTIREHEAAGEEH